MNISAIILAAGKSARMGQNKLLMPWGNTTVLEKVIQTVQSAGIEDIILVTNPDLQFPIPDSRFPIPNLRITINSTNHEMLSSIQLGLQNLTPSQPPPNPLNESAEFSILSVADLPLRDAPRGEVPKAEGVLICLGDQPQVEERSVRLVCEAYQRNKSNLVVPSYQMRRGHPWLVARPLWGEILNMNVNQSPRDFLNAHAAEIEYVNVDTPTILQDVDTPADYLKYKPNV